MGAVALVAYLIDKMPEQERAQANESGLSLAARLGGPWETVGLLVSEHGLDGAAASQLMTPKTLALMSVFSIFAARDLPPLSFHL